MWGASGRASWTTVDTWLGAPGGAALAASDLVRRYLAAFGPALVADVQHWSGLPGLAEVVGPMGLRTFRDEHGRTLYDLPEAPLTDPDTPAPVRFACDADIWRVILDPGTGQPLDVGRRHRLVPPWIRRALHARDRG